MRNPKCHIIYDIMPWKCVQNLVNKHSFAITDATLDKHSNGLLTITVNWTGTDNRGSFRSVKFGGTSWSSDNGEIMVTLEFPGVKYRKSFKGVKRKIAYDFGFSIGLSPNNRRAKLRYDYIGLTNLKYGAEIVFAPSSWNMKGVEMDSMTPDDFKLVA